MGDLPLGLSFDDVLLVPQRSGVLPAEVDISTRLTGDIPLNIPIISSAMDTVTEDGLAIALAREGGLGVIHRNMPISVQADMVAKVKRSETTVIVDPFTTASDVTIAHLQEVMREKGVNGFPVVDDSGILVGMVTSRDIWFVEDASAPVSAVMTPRERLVTATLDTDLDEARRILQQNRIEKLPLIDGAGRLAGLITAQDIEKSDMFLNAAKDQSGRLRVGAAIGVGEDFFDRARAVIEAGADAVFIDAATGHTERVLFVIEKLRSEFSTPVVAGNVVTAAGAADLISAGAAAIKVGIGPGSICTTRVIAGVGVPQFSAIQNVSPVCRDKGISLIADGGIRYSGDVVKAMAAGADIVMLGSLLAGCQESPGETVQYQGRTWKEYRGMGSLKAMRKGSGDRYGQNSSGKLVAEGVEARVPYRGLLADTVFQLLGGLRSGMGYVGAGSLLELRERASFIRITSGGLKESHAHDITITEEPINYQQSS
ncbi:MAG: IMP dehydrogenase [Verrucomicrobiales bacterium]|jgi:IMP dehydrogenase|nr:IMP dehydrogenase [Verrucomicrobiales bacterium]HQZ28486.1 IMP dehydrogenase [Verrucomicrobiales bacterium]